MSGLFELIPLIGFIGTYLVARFLEQGRNAIYWATAALMLVLIVQWAYLYFGKKTIKKSFLLVLVMVLILGSITLLLRNPIFIYLKPTIVNIAFSLILLISPYVYERLLVQMAFEKVLDLPPKLWMRLHYSCIVFLLFCAGMNYWVVKNCSEEFWVGFKFWGLSGCTFLFLLAVMFVLRQYLKFEQSPEQKL